MAEEQKTPKKTPKRPPREKPDSVAEKPDTPSETNSETPIAVQSGIRSDIEMPKGASGRNANYQFGEMAVGDMFFIDPKRKATVTSAARRYSRSNPNEDGSQKKFVIRSFPPESSMAGKSGCWRVKDVLPVKDTQAGTGSEDI